MTENSQSENTSQPKPALPAHQTAASKAKVSISASLRELLGTGLVLIALAALGFWGHHSGWKMPKLSELTRSHLPTNEDWCSEHGVPESQCVECDATLMPRKEFGWCKTHGIPNCPLEHPEIAQLKT